MKNDDTALELAGLTVTVMRGQYPESHIEWDRNWLLVRVRCVFDTASVEFMDPCLTTGSFYSFKNEIEELQKDESDSATLDSVEPYFSLVISKIDGLGHYLARIEATSDHILQGHWFDSLITSHIISYWDRFYSGATTTLTDDPITGGPGYRKVKLLPVLSLQKYPGYLAAEKCGIWAGRKPRKKRSGTRE